MSKNLVLLIGALLVVFVLIALVYQPTTAARKVVVYSSVDADFALPLFELFKKETGIEVVARLDSEETKTTGLAQRLMQMKANPDGDVFWNSEMSFTQLLAKDGVLQAYVSPNAAGIPEQFKDAGGLWAGFGCRARVVIFNTKTVKREDAPKTLEDFSNPRWKGRFAIAKPLFGTTRSHLTALFLELGPEKGLALFNSWRANGVMVVNSNGAVRDRVADGSADVGLTDTDDVYSAMDRKKPVDFVVPDQTREWPGVFLIPNTVGMLRNCPHPEEARMFIDFLLRPETERWLAEHDSRQIPVRATGAKLAAPFDTLKLVAAKFDAHKVADKVMTVGEIINAILTAKE